MRKEVNELTVSDILVLIHHILTNINHYRDRLFEVEAEYDAANFTCHDGRDDLRRCRYILAWNSNFVDGYYHPQVGKPEKIPIIHARKMWESF